MITVLVAAFATLVVVGARLLARDRAALVEEFSRDRLHALQEGARSFADDVKDIGNDLDLASALLQRVETDHVAAERELHAVATVERAYMVMEARDGTGFATQVVALDAPPEALTWTRTALDTTLQQARAAPGALHVSGPLDVRDDRAAWYRVFARRKPNSTMAVAVAVDMNFLLARLRLLHDRTSALLVVDPTHAPAPPSDPAMIPLANELPPGATTFLVDDERAESLGLPRAPAVVAVAPVAVGTGAPWTIAVASSTVVLETQEQNIVRRLTVGSILALVLLAAAATYLVVNARRAAALHERLRNADRLAHLTEKAEKILDHIPSGVLALGDSGRISSSNRSFELRVGQPVVDRTLDEIFAGAPPEHVRALDDLVAAALRTKLPRSLHRIRLALFGVDSYLGVHAIPLARPIADVSILLVFEDLAPLQRAEEQLLHSEKLVTAGALAAGIAHEIGTPLSVIRGHAELALAKLGGEHPQSSGQRTIVEQSDYVIEMIRRLLDYVHPANSSHEPVAIEPAMRNVVELLSPQAVKRGVALAVDVEAAAPNVSADAGQLRQVLVNLVMNSIDACDSGGTVELRARGAGDRVIVEVSDDGVGIPPESRAHVFDPFFTTKKRGQGTGLGLWVVAQLVQLHGAEIELADQDRGTAFILRWPTA
jgi:signal transduction histidine kinase